MTDIMVADRIKNLREQANFTQAALARKLGVTYSVDNGFILSHGTIQVKAYGGLYHGQTKQL